MTALDSRILARDGRLRAVPRRPGHGLDRGDGPEHGADDPPGRSPARGLRRAPRADRPGHRLHGRRGVRRPPSRGPPARRRRTRTHRSSGSSPRATRRPCPTARSPSATWSASSGRSAGATAGSSRSASTTRPGAIVARVSWWGGSAARLGRRLARHAPAQRRTTAPVGRPRPVPGPDPADHGTHALARPGDSCGREVTGTWTTRAQRSSPATSRTS